MKKWLPLLILLMGLLYIFFIPEEPIVLKLLFKIIPMILILYYAYSLKDERLTRYQKMILIGLFFCMIGDATLIWFTVGLSAFLIGHLFYISAFLHKWKFTIIRFSTILPIGLYSWWIGMEIVEALIQNNEQSLFIPVILYIGVISIMGWFAFMTGDVLAILGGILFVISDSILAWNKFVSAIPFAGILIMITYYLAQFLIASSVQSQTQKNKPTALYE